MNDQFLPLLEDLSKNKIKLSKSRYTLNGVPVPSVTQILSKCINEPHIAQWANYLGFRRIKYQEELNRAATIGTKGHNAIEAFINDEINDEGNMCLQSFLVWWEIINTNHQIEILGMEEKIILPYCGGTYDLLISIDGKIYLVDFKTSNHVTYKYFIQLAAYRHMVYTNKGINIDGCIILQVNKFEPLFTEYLLDFSNDEHYAFIEHCANTFFSLCVSFYHISQAEAMFKNIF